MQLLDLFEYKLVKGEDFNVFQNPSANELLQLIKNSYTMQNFGHIDFEGSGINYDQISDISLGHIHGLDYPLRGFIVDNKDVYIVDSFYADHETLHDFLYQNGISTDAHYSNNRNRPIPISIDREANNQYFIAVRPALINDIKKIFSIKRLNLPVKEW